MLFEIGILIGFVIFVVAETYFFLMQRVPLTVSRENDIDPKIGRFMLPSWYLFVWPAKAGKWLFLFFVWQSFGWIPAIICFLMQFLINMMLPVPFTYYSNIFEKHLVKELSGPNHDIAMTLHGALTSSRSKHSF